MANPSVTYTLVNGTANDATQVNTNFTDIINSLTDGTKDLTVAGVTTTNLTTTNLLSSLLPTDSTYDLGSTSKNFKSLYLDNGATDGGAVYFNKVTTSYIKAGADGLSLVLQGFTSGVQIGDGTYTGTDPLLIVNANTGDAALRLQVNNTSANAWDLQVDNSDSDNLEVGYNGTEKFRFVSGSGSEVLAFNNTEISTATAPVKNTLYPHNFIKAWGTITSTGSGTSLTLTDSFNIDTVTYNTGSDYIDIAFHTAMANTSYAVITSLGIALVLVQTTDTKTTGGFYLRHYSATAGTVFDFNSSASRICHFIVVGLQ